MVVCICAFCNVCVFVCVVVCSVGFVMCEWVYGWACVCVGFLRCGCVNVWEL